MELAELMKELASELGLGEIELEEDGGGQITIDDDLAIDLEAAEDGFGFVISATVGTIPDEEREAVFAELLEANLLGQGTGGASLALDSTLNEIVLCRSIPQDDLRFEVFDQELVTFVEALRWWRERLESGALGAKEEPQAASAVSMRPGGEGMIQV